MFSIKARSLMDDKEVLGSNPQLWKTFFRQHLFGSKLIKKFWKTQTWNCCMCCNPANGRVDFEK
jgi:hypothetical protein